MGSLALRSARPWRAMGMRDRLCGVRELRQPPVRQRAAAVDRLWEAIGLAAVADSIDDVVAAAAAGRAARFSYRVMENRRH